VSSTRSLLVALGALALGSAGLVLPAPAVAAPTPPTIVEVGDGYHFVGGAENNDVHLTVVNGRLLVQDFGATSFGYVGSKCVEVPTEGTATISCKIKSPTVFHADLRAGDDDLNAFGLPKLIRLDVRTGDGNNTVIGGIGNDVIRGQSSQGGSDSLSGGFGNDRLTSGNGAGFLSGGDGNDIIVGGPGIDSVQGGAGDDYVRSGGGNDLVYGNSGNDGLSGDGDDDLIRGGPGNDHLYGGEDDDDLLGGLGRNTYAGQNGDDVLHARNATRDSVNCGGGDDDATVDPQAVLLGISYGGDTVAQCEDVVSSGPLDPED
jgi:Ca2+-binding RTX toxin-like protein